MATLPQDVEEFGTQVMSEMDREFHESPDRVIAVIGAAYLDAMLERLLRSVFISDDEAAGRLLRPDAPLGSNGARFQLAYCLALITRDQRDDFRLIARIRNAFAHDFKAASFNTEPVRGYCSSLKQPSIVAAMPKQLLDEKTAAAMSQYVNEEMAGTPREMYRTAVFALFGSMLRRLVYLRPVSASSWFTYDPDRNVGPSGPAANT